MATAETTRPARPGFDEIDPPSREKILDCVHCGLCLPTCPTYVALGTEMDSPRGRIYLIRQVQEGKLGITDSFVKHMYTCLVCRACETACPSGVQFGSLMERARGQIERHYRRPLPSRLARWFGYAVVLPNPRVLGALVTLIGLYQRSGLRALVRKTGLVKLFGAKNAQREALLPDVPPPADRRPLPEFTAAKGERRGKVALLAGCVMREVFQATNRATIRVLSENGWDVVVPRDQGCCGALHVHEGELERGKALARRDIAAFEAADVDYVVTNVAGCGSVMKEWGELFEHDPEWAERAKRVAARVRDVTELLAAFGPLRGRLGRLDLTVAYHEPCHLAHAQKVRQEPREVLRQIPGVTLTEIRESDWCCGSAGVYNVVHPDLSMRILDRKMSRVGEVKADVLATGNPGCLIQIGKGMARVGLRMPVVHPVDLLARAYEAGDGAAAAGARFDA
ncbi:MAG TPA: heterodisulfide reductase-related iron-sulfur binding cluster [Thermodesulfobacteriota bacterium]